MEKQSNVTEKVNHLFRYEYGKLVSVLTKTFGPSNIELAEDVVQEAMLEAVEQWAYKGFPDNPVGWLHRVAKYKAVTVLNREKHKIRYTSTVAQSLQSKWTAEPVLNHIFTDKEIADDQLRMMFTCCHPAVSTDSQIALTLKTLCGFSIPEIAKAFLTNEENIAKRLVRARKNIRDADIPFEVPAGKELQQRLANVLESIYLLFNEGYNASSGNNLIKYELCEEAIRLAQIIAANVNITSKSNVYALLALMSFNASRFKSRIDEYDNIIDLEHQDRGSWNKELIQNGLVYLELSSQENVVSTYHILAAISAHYCTANNFDATDWENILCLYDNLIEIDKSPIVLLNRAVVISKTADAKNALIELEKIEDKASLLSYLPYYSSKAELHFQNHETEIAVLLLNRALELQINKDSKAYINNRLQFFLKSICRRYQIKEKSCKNLCYSSKPKVTI